MNFNALRYFVTVYDEKSMTKAAKKLFVSQSSLSQCIRQLEKIWELHCLIVLEPHSSQHGLESIMHIGQNKH
jgi:isoprenylcysteine carboxyl methyltransferase (ICMT) family protein YpbQ